MRDEYEYRLMKTKEGFWMLEVPPRNEHELPMVAVSQGGLRGLMKIMKHILKLERYPISTQRKEDF